MLTGGWNIIDQNGIKLEGKPQEAFNSLPKLGATYKPIAYCGTQVVNGVNYGFIAQEVTYGHPIETHIVKIVINEHDGKYENVLSKFERLF